MMPKLVTFASFLHTLKRYEDSQHPDYSPYFIRLRSQLSDINKLFFGSKPYNFRPEDLQLKEQLAPKVEFFVHKPSGSQVVIKYFRIPWDAYPMTHLKIKLKNLEREIGLVRRLNSLFLAKVYGYEIYGDHILIFMEKMTFSLKDLYAKANTDSRMAQIPEETLKKVAFSTIQALLLCESQKPKILARDIKPGNILINISGRNFSNIKDVKLCDFGTLRELEKAVHHRKQEEMVYWPPETCWGTRYDERKDVWGLGITILEACKEFIPDDFSIATSDLKSNIHYQTVHEKVNDVHENAEIFLDQVFVHKYSLEFKNFIEECLSPLRYRPKLKDLVKNPILASCGHNNYTSDRQKGSNVGWKRVYTLYFVLILLLGGGLFYVLYEEDIRNQNRTMGYYDSRNYGAEAKNVDKKVDDIEDTSIKDDLLLTVLNLTMETQEAQEDRLKRQEREIQALKSALAAQRHPTPHSYSNSPIGYGYTPNSFIDQVQAAKNHLSGLEYHSRRLEAIETALVQQSLSPATRNQPASAPSVQETVHETAPKMSSFEEYGAIARFFGNMVASSVDRFIFWFMIIAMVLGGIVLVTIPPLGWFVYVKYMTRPRIYRLKKRVNWAYLTQVMPKVLLGTKSNKL